MIKPQTAATTIRCKLVAVRNSPVAYQSNALARILPPPDTALEFVCRQGGQAALELYEFRPGATDDATATTAPSKGSPGGAPGGPGSLL